MRKTVLFVNDNYFTYLLAKPFLDRYHQDVAGIIFSSKTSGSISNIIDVYKRTYLRYFVYRSFVEVAPKLIPYFRRRTVMSLARRFGIKTGTMSDINTCSDLFTGEMGLTLNFDQVIGKETLKSFPLGIINVHASKLPKDKGISPALWAFARGDQSIWVTIYQLNDRIDSGAIFEQFEVPVLDSDSAFSLYARVCEQSGCHLPDVVEQISHNAISPRAQKSVGGQYWSWPDATHLDMMNRSGKRFLRLKEILGRSSSSHIEA